MNQQLRVYGLASLIILGLLFRVAHLDQKIFWVDEVATAIRAAGHTRAEVITQLATGQPHSPADLLAYQQLNPPQLSPRSLTDSLSALSRSPEHTPLYFLLVRFWMEIFGSSTGAIRSLSVLCSLLALPALYQFCRELGCELGGCELSCEPGRELGREHREAIAQLAVGFMAVSPFFVAYAQEARPYSLWLLTLIVSSTALLRAIRRNKSASWVIYALSLTLSLYTSLLTVFVAVGQAVYVALQLRDRRQYLAAICLAGILFLPWIWVIWSQQTALEANITWMQTAAPGWLTPAIWLYSAAVIWFDLPVVATGWLAAAEAVIAASVLAILGNAIVKLMRLPSRIGLYLGALGLPVPVALLLLDIVRQGQAAATSRYLISAQLALLIAMAAGVSQFKQRPRQLAIGLLLSLSLISCWVNLKRIPDYQKDRNRANPELAALINASPKPVLFAEPSQTLDLLSLSHSLRADTQIWIGPVAQLPQLPQPPQPPQPNSADRCPPSFLFNPSEAMLTAAQQLDLNPSPAYQPQRLLPQDSHLSLWQICSP